MRYIILAIVFALIIGSAGYTQAVNLNPFASRTPINPAVAQQQAAIERQRVIVNAQQAFQERMQEINSRLREDIIKKQQEIRDLQIRANQDRMQAHKQLQDAIHGR